MSENDTPDEPTLPDDFEVLTVTPENDARIAEFWLEPKHLRERLGEDGVVVIRKEDNQLVTTLTRESFDVAVRTGGYSGWYPYVPPAPEPEPAAEVEPAEANPAAPPVAEQ